MQKRLLILPVSAIVITSLIFGCSSTKNAKFPDTDKNYKQALELQKHKAEINQRELESEKLASLDNDPLLLEQLGDTYVKQGNNMLAFTQYGKALQMKPDRTVLRQKMADLMLRQGMPSESMSEYDIVLKQDPENINALNGKATALLRLSRFKEAETIANKAVAVRGGSWQTYALLGVIYDRQKQNEAATEAYKKALVVNPGAATLYNNLGLTLYRNSQYRESADAFLKAISLNAGSSKTYNSLGLALFKIGLSEEALEAFRKAGDDAEAYYAIAVLHMENQDYTKAADFFQRAIDAKPTYYKSAQEGLAKAHNASQKITASKPLSLAEE